MDMDNLAVEHMDDDSLDVRFYFGLFFMNWWLILLSMILAGAATFLVSMGMTPYYESSTTVLVNEAPATKATDYNSVLTSTQLTSTYSQMMARDPVLKEVADQVGLTNPPEEFKEWITVTPVRNTQLIQVTVKTTDPWLSSKIANSIVTVFATQIQEIQTQRFAQSKTTLKTQLAETERQISTFSTQAETAATIEERTRLDAKVAQYNTIYSNLLLSYEQVRLSEAQTVSSVVQVEPASPVLIPVEPRVILNTILASLLGILLSIGAIVARESLDDTIKTPDDITRKFKLPVLGVINHHEPEIDSPITLTDPRSPIAEAYRILRTNVSYTSVDRPLRTLMVTSAEPGDGKTTTTSNLGVVMAQNGKKVIIADCDLRRPHIHTYFGLNNQQGISTLFAHSPGMLDRTRQLTKVEGLSIITSGLLPPNPSELMSSQKMQTILNVMCQATEVVLIDTPPILTVSDASALAPSLDGVLLVVRPGKTRTSILRQTLEQLRQVNARVLGIVLNDVDTRGKSYGYHYKYYRGYEAYQSYYETKGKGRKGK